MRFTIDPPDCLANGRVKVSVRNALILRSHAPPARAQDKSPPLRLGRRLVRGAEHLRVLIHRPEADGLAPLVELCRLGDALRLTPIAFGVELRSVELLLSFAEK